MTARSGWFRELRDDLRRAWKLQGIVGIRKEIGARTVQRVWRSGRYLVFEQDHRSIRDAPMPEGVKIATVTSGDWPALAGILPQRSLEAYRSWVTRGRVMLVAWRGTRPVGHLWYTDRVEPEIEHFDLPLPAGAVYGFNMYVIPEERKKGIGAALTTARGRHARDRGFARCWRVIRVDNTAARRIAVRASHEEQLEAPIGELTWTKLLSWSRTRYVPYVEPPISEPSTPTPSAPTAGRGLLGGMMLYGTTRGITEGLLGARGVALASILGPAGLGVWTMFRLATQYLGFASLGITGGLEREVAQRGEPQDPATRREVDAAARTTLGFLLAVFGTLGVMSGLAALFVESGAVRVILCALTVVLVTENVVLYALVMLRCRGELWRYGVLEIVLASIHLVLATLLALRWGVPGALTGFALASLAGTVVALRRSPVRPSFDREVFRRLLRVGFPARLNLLLGTALVTADRWVVGGLEGTEALGRYAFAVAVAGLAATVVWVARIVVFPGVYRAVRIDGSVALRRHLSRTVLLFAGLLPPLLGAVALLLAPVVAYVLPEYAGAIAPTKILIFTGVTAAISSLGALGVVAADRQRWLPAISATALALNVMLAIGALRAGLGLAGVAVAALVSRSLVASAILAVFADAAEVHPRRALFDAFVPGAWCLAAVLLLARWFPSPDALSSVKALAVYVVMLLPLTPGWIARIREARSTSS